MIALEKPQSPSRFLRPPKDAIMRFRCSNMLKQRMTRIAVIRDVDISDLLREACHSLASKYESSSLP